MLTSCTHQPCLTLQRDPKSRCMVSLAKPDLLDMTDERVSYHVYLGLRDCWSPDPPWVPSCAWGTSQGRPSLHGPSTDVTTLATAVCPGGRGGRGAPREAYLQVELHQLIFLHEVVKPPSSEPGLSSLVFLPKVNEDTQALLDAGERLPERPGGTDTHQLGMSQGTPPRGLGLTQHQIKLRLWERVTLTLVTQRCWGLI